MFCLEISANRDMTPLLRYFIKHKLICRDVVISVLFTTQIDVTIMRSTGSFIKHVVRWVRFLNCSEELERRRFGGIIFIKS